MSWTNGVDQYLFDFGNLAALPDSVVEEMLQAEGEVIRRAQSSTASSMLQGRYNKGAVARAAKVGKKSTALISYRLEQLEKKVMLHNSVVECVYDLEQHAAVVGEKMKVADHRISDLEKS